MVKRKGQMDKSKCLIIKNGQGKRSKGKKKINVQKILCPKVKVKSPKVKVKSPNVKVKSPNVKVKSPNVNVKSPNVTALGQFHD